MNAELAVLADLGGPLSCSESGRKLERFATAFERHGHTRCVVELTGGPEPHFVGDAGVMPADGDHPLGPHHEIGWRLGTSFRRWPTVVLS